MVEAEKKGFYVDYRVADEQVCRFFHSLRGLAETRLSEVEQGYFEGLHESADVAFPFEPVRDGQEVEIGNIRANQGRPEPQP